MTIEIKPATFDDARRVTAELRESSAWEYARLRLDDEKIASLLAVSEAYIGYADGKPVIVWGVAQPEGPLAPATLWLLAGEDMEQFRFSFGKHSISFVRHALEKYGGLQGYALAENERSCRWLDWLGFRELPPVEFEEGLLTRRFELWQS